MDKADVDLILAALEQKVKVLKKQLEKQPNVEESKAVGNFIRNFRYKNIR